MKKFVTLLFFCVTVLAFMAAVLEVDLFGYDHTFFDTYDQYIPGSGNYTYDLACDYKVPKAGVEFPLFFTTPDFFLTGLVSGQSQSFPFNERLPITSRRLFLKHRSLLI